MKKQYLFNLVLVLSFSVLVFFGCSSSVKKADIPATADPHEEVSKLESDLGTALTKNVDVLATSEYQQSQKYLDRAKKAIEKGKPQADALDELRMSRGYLQEAVVLSLNRGKYTEELFITRQMALGAGVNSHPELRKDLAKLDSEVSNKSDRLEDLDADKLANFQSRYLDLERRSVILSQLGTAQAMVNGAEKNYAKRKAPLSFKNAELALTNAELMISTNVRNPSGYQEAVSKANKEANQLINVMSVIDKNGKDLDESVAIKLVAQNRTISGLTTELDTNAAKNAVAQALMRERNKELSSDVAAQKQNLAAANSKIQIQRALESARSQFTEDEAEAYLQGNNLVIRLKKVNFASGRSDLPETSLSLLAKVSDVAKSLNPTLILVEGHTDSVGSAAENKTISEQRANSVASYLKSNGFTDTKVEAEGLGFKKPIATNKSKEGRAQNRRVDVIITPEDVVSR